MCRALWRRWLELMGDITRVQGEPGRYFVPSSSGQNPPYLVDICANQGNGWCGCDDFYNRQQGRWERGEPGPHRCKHLRSVRAWELEQSHVSEEALDRWVRLWNLAHPQKED